MYFVIRNLHRTMILMVWLHTVALVLSNRLHVTLNELVYKVWVTLSMVNIEPSWFSMRVRSIDGGVPYMNSRAPMHLVHITSVPSVRSLVIHHWIFSDSSVQFARHGNVFIELLMATPKHSSARKRKNKSVVFNKKSECPTYHSVRWRQGEKGRVAAAAWWR